MALGYRDRAAEKTDLPPDPFARAARDDARRDRLDPTDPRPVCRSGGTHEIVRTRIAADLVRTLCVRCGELHLDLREDTVDRWCAAMDDDGRPCPLPALPTDADRFCERHATIRSRAQGLFSRRIGADLFVVARMGSFSAAHRRSDAA